MKKKEEKKKENWIGFGLVDLDRHQYHLFAAELRALPA